MEATIDSTRTPLIQAISSQLQDLPQESIRDVLAFVEFLKWKAQSTSQPKRGSAEALLACAGTWVFDKGEREMIQEEIRSMREFVDE